MARLALFTACLTAQACAPAEDAPGDPHAASPFVPQPRAGVAPLELESIDKIDVLFVVDTSGSMREEHATLAAQFPALARALASGDIDADGERDFPPPRDVQFGVVSSDLGLPPALLRKRNPPRARS